MELGLTVRTANLEPALGIMADVAANAAFAPDKVELAKGQAVDDATLALQNPGALSRIAAARAVFGNGAYGAPAGGTPASLAAIGRADVVAAAGQSLRPDKSVLVLSGVTPGARIVTQGAELLGQVR